MRIHNNTFHDKQRLTALQKIVPEDLHSRNSGSRNYLSKTARKEGPVKWPSLTYYLIMNAIKSLFFIPLQGNQRIDRDVVLAVVEV